MLLQLAQFVPIATLVVICITWIIIKLRDVIEQSSKIQKGLRKLPGPRQWPIIGSALELNLRNEDFNELQHRYRRIYGERFVFKLAYVQFLMLFNPDDVEKLLSSSVHIEKSMAYTFLHSWLGDGLLTSTGAKWQKRRKMLTPSFHFKILEDFLIIFNEQAQILVDVLRKDFKNGKINDICPYISRCTLDVIGETAMDRKFNAQKDKDSPYVRAVLKVCEIIMYQVMRPYLWSDWVMCLTPSGRAYKASLKVLHDFTNQVIRERKASALLLAKDTPSKGKSEEEDVYWHGKRRLAFLDLLLEAQKNPENNLTDTDIREEVDTFMFEGHDTTAASLSWTIYLLGSHPHFQAKVHEELDRIFADGRNRPITTKDLSEMKYLEMCIKESLRLFPSVPFMSRQLTSDLVLDNNFTAPAGTALVLLSLPIHRNEKIFPDPEAFIPERFLPENTAKRHPFAYIPFSAGPRNCIGQKFAMMEEKVVLANLFRNFRVEALDSMESITVMLEVITRPKDGLNIRLVPR